MVKFYKALGAAAYLAVALFMLIPLSGKATQKGNNTSTPTAVASSTNQTVFGAQINPHFEASETDIQTGVFLCLEGTCSDVSNPDARQICQTVNAKAQLLNSGDAASLNSLNNTINNN